MSLGGRTLNWWPRSGLTLFPQTGKQLPLVDDSWKTIESADLVSEEEDDDDDNDGNDNDGSDNDGNDNDGNDVDDPAVSQR